MHQHPFIRLPLSLCESDPLIIHESVIELLRHHRWAGGISSRESVTLHGPDTALVSLVFGLLAPTSWWWLLVSDLWMCLRMLLPCDRDAHAHPNSSRYSLRTNSLRTASGLKAWFQSTRMNRCLGPLGSCFIHGNLDWRESHKFERSELPVVLRVLRLFTSGRY